MRDFLGFLTFLLILLLVVPTMLPIAAGWALGGSSGVVIGLVVLAAAVLLMGRKR